MKKAVIIFLLSLLPPLVLYYLLIFEKTQRPRKEKLTLVLLNAFIWTLISSITLTPQVWGL